MHIPVVLMTAKSMVVHIKEGFSVGADDYIVKPFSMDVLICRINSLLEYAQAVNPASHVSTVPIRPSAAS